MSAFFLQLFGIYNPGNFNIFSSLLILTFLSKEFISNVFLPLKQKLGREEGLIKMKGKEGSLRKKSNNLNEDGNNI